MTVKEKSIKEKPPWISSREVGVIAAFGGLLFASVALGLVIPITPVTAFWALEPLAFIGAFATGPIGGVIIYGLMGTPRPAALLNWMIFAPQGSVAGLLYYVARDWKNRYKIPYVWGIFALIWLVIIPFPEAWAYVYIQRLIPESGLWEWFWLLFWTFEVPEFFFMSIGSTIVLLAFPKFVRPDWWDRWKVRIRGS